MSLVEKTLFGTIDKVARSIERIKHFEPPEGYYLAFSGGKDSIVIHRLAEMAGVKFTAHYSYPGLDPRELVNFIKREYPDVVFHYPSGMTYGKRFVKYGMPPLRQQRWCCALLKEGQGSGTVMLGIRWAESSRRAKRQVVEPCNKKKQKWYVSPIIDWEDGDVWTFIRKHKMPYCSLYDEGYKRLGCVCCPYASKMQRRAELERFPRFKKMYLSLFRRSFEMRKRRGFPLLQDTPEEWFRWWLMHSPKNEIKGQCYLFDN